METLETLAAKHAGDIVRLALKHASPRKALVVFDARTPLARLVTSAYRAALQGDRTQPSEPSPGQHAETIAEHFSAPIAAATNPSRRGAFWSAAGLCSSTQCHCRQK